MKRLVFSGLLALILLIASGAAAKRAVSSPMPARQNEATTSPSLREVGRRSNFIPASIDTTPFVSSTIVRRAFASVPSRTVPCRHVRGGVVNHHVLASDLLAGFFTELARCRPDVTRIILLSPDHYHAGSAPITTHETPYRTEEGTVEADATSVHRLLAMVLSAREESIPFANEHGIGALVPFLHQVLPAAKIVPVMISARVTQDDAARFAAWLAKELDRSTIVIVSSDMSHYLPEATARTNDETTLKAFASGDRDFFWSATDANTDNGRSIWIAEKALGRSAWSLFGHGISTDYGGSRQYTTSYMTGFWY